MRELGIDIETFSGADLAKCGVYRYAEDEAFEVLLFAYSVDGAAPRVVDFASGESLPDDVLEALTDPAVVKTAWNAAFERVCLSRWLNLGRMLPPEQWRCTMVAAARLGLPLSLGQCAETLGLEKGKMTEGRALVRRFSMPRRDGGRNMPGDDPEKWATFRAYNLRDVEVEQAILAKVRRMPVPEWEQELYTADQLINDRGVAVDVDFARNAVALDGEYRRRLSAEMAALGVDASCSPAALKDFLRRETGLAFASVAKGTLDDMADALEHFPKARRAVAIRRELGKTSNRKYDAMLSCVCRDGRIRGLLQFHGAARTGRWAGRLVQVQNLPQNHLPDIARARAMAKEGDPDELELNYERPMQVLSELIRTAFIAPDGRTLHVCDFSAIEARVIAWLAGEAWVLDVFRAGGDIYCATASQMFRCRVEKHGENAHLRPKGKIAVLALGYGGGVSALEAMGGARMGLSETEMRGIVARWREANPKIVRLWKAVERCARAALTSGGEAPGHRGLRFRGIWGGLAVTLPSGRTLFYPRARVEEENGHESIVYEGTDQTSGRWTTLRTYGGKLTENLVQAIARDILGAVILRARRRGLEIVFHIHDEIVVEAPAEVPLSAVEELFATPPSWCPDLPLSGAGYSTPYYLKD